MNFENAFEYTYLQYTLVGHVFTLGYAAMAGALLYFVLTIRDTLPRYQLASTLSAVVMVSAFFQLLVISDIWNDSFTWNGKAFVTSETLFSNGYRYMNWSIDVPVLLLQLLIVLGITGAPFRRGWVIFTGAGLGMIFTGYLGQFYEVERSADFWIWGGISTLFFLVILVLVQRVVYRNLDRLPVQVHSLVRGVWWLLLVSWMLYPLGYAMPAVLNSADGVVLRQVLYTVADIVSKIIYGIMLTVIARRISMIEGHEAAAAASIGAPRGGVTDVGAPGRI